MSLFLPRKCYMGCVFYRSGCRTMPPSPHSTPTPSITTPCTGLTRWTPTARCSTRRPRDPSQTVAWISGSTSQDTTTGRSQTIPEFLTLPAEKFRGREISIEWQEKVYDSLFGNWGQALFRPAKNWERACLAIVLCPGLRKCIYWFKVPGPHLQICIHTITFKYLSHLSEEIFQQANRRTII